MTPGLPYPTPEEVEAASRSDLRHWLNELPGDADKAHHALIQRIIDRLAEFRANPYAAPAQAARKALARPEADYTQPTPKPAPKPAKKAPAAPAAEATDMGYFKTLFGR